MNLLRRFQDRAQCDIPVPPCVYGTATAGGGIGIISRLGITAELQAGMLTVLDVAGWDCRRPLTLVQPKDRYLSPSQRAFREFLMAERPFISGPASTS